MAIQNYQTDTEHRFNTMELFYKTPHCLRTIQ
ncbi:hypothetical protein T10_11562 [Trichinella papuae]|uniref:Uncharacterized protein n=1 Tax=Trichinella papuae TaxID=268474 RepID=A0A0V1M039_9BILA|nr:hypothetical protein T10_11562 [Trichinella papuae]